MPYPLRYCKSLTLSAVENGDNTDAQDDDEAFSPVLKANMAILRQRDGGYGRVRFAKRLEVGTSTIERALNGAGGVQLQKIATYFEMEVWQLLMPDFGADIDWPFPNTDRRRYLQLSPNLRGIVEGKLQAALDEVAPKANSAA